MHTLYARTLLCGYCILFNLYNSSCLGSRSFSALRAQLFSAVGDGVQNVRYLVHLDRVGSNPSLTAVFLLVLLHVCSHVKQLWMYRESQLIPSARGAKVCYMFFVFIFLSFMDTGALSSMEYFFINLSDLPSWQQYYRMYDLHIALL